MTLFPCKLTDLTLSRCLSVASICPQSAPHPALWSEGPHLGALWQVPNCVQSLAAVTTAQVQARTLSFSVPSVLLPPTSIPSSTAARDTLLSHQSRPTTLCKTYHRFHATPEQNPESASAGRPLRNSLLPVTDPVPSSPPSLAVPCSAPVHCPAVSPGKTFSAAEALPEVCWVAPEWPLLHDLVSSWYCQQFTIFVSVLTSGTELKYQLKRQEQAPVLCFFCILCLDDSPVGKPSNLRGVVGQPRGERPYRHQAMEAVHTGLTRSLQVLRAGLLP